MAEVFFLFNLLEGTSSPVELSTKKEGRRVLVSVLLGSNADIGSLEVSMLLIILSERLKTETNVLHNGIYERIHISRVHLQLNPKEIDTKGFSTESVTVFRAFYRTKSPLILTIRK